MVYIRKHSALLALSVLLTYFYIAQVSIQNKHTHFYPNGVVVTHSHPLSHQDDAPIQNHKHTKTEICFFSNFHFDYYNTPRIENISFERDFVQFEYLVKNESDLYSVFQLTEAPRGPPA